MMIYLFHTILWGLSKLCRKKLITWHFSQGCSEMPRDAQGCPGMPRDTQRCVRDISTCHVLELKAHDIFPRDVQGCPGMPRDAQRNSGKLKDAQGWPGMTRETQRSSGKLKDAQGCLRDIPGILGDPQECLRLPVIWGVSPETPGDLGTLCCLGVPQVPQNILSLSWG